MSCLGMGEHVQQLICEPGSSGECVASAMIVVVHGTHTPLLSYLSILLYNFNNLNASLYSYNDDWQCKQVSRCICDGCAYI